MRSSAADLLKRVTDFEQRSTAANQRVERVEDVPTADGPRVARPDLRLVKAGEAQLQGDLLAIECPRGMIRLVVEHDGQTSRVHAKVFDGIEFITYRQDRGGTISCGERPADDHVIVTYRPGPRGSSLGEIVAVEFMPTATPPTR